MSLDSYNKKRNFKKTPEPKGRVDNKSKNLYVIQKHAASHLHYDLRLEIDGVLKSWAVPKGPCLDPHVKRLAMQVEDHPVGYGTFEGLIPKGEYGGGTVMLWDKGIWEPLDGDPSKAYEKGHLRFNLYAEKLNGRWDLIRFKEKGEWFLVKTNDEFAKPLTDYDITMEEPLSVRSQQSMDEITENYQSIWNQKDDNSLQKRYEFAPDLPKKPFPESVSVQLATLVGKPPAGDPWLHEIKFDGYRMVALKKGNNVTLTSRNHIDWTTKFQNVVEEIKKLPVKNVIFDGEVVVLDEKKRSSFQRLQNSIESGENGSFLYYVFDLLYLEHYDLRSLPLIERKKILQSLIPKKNSSLHYSDHIQGSGDDFFEQACQFELEGIVSKKADSPYLEKRSQSWLKTKCVKRQEFVVGGFTQPKGGRNYFGSLFLGVFDHKKQLIFSGNVGTGFTQASLKALHTKLEKLIIKDNPFTTKPPASRTATWVKPEMVVEVEFTEWTDDGHLRHPSFKGIRMDKKPDDILREKEQKPSTKPKESKIALTHPDKILYAEDSISKQELLEYYQEVGDYMLPYVKNRLLTLVRCPSTYNDCFYQKHLTSKSNYFHTLAVSNSKGETEDYFYMDNEAAFAAIVQMGALEIHPWGSTIEHLENPDMLVFDLDPAPDVSWKRVVAAAFEVKEHLQHYHLQSFVKTTGGKGLHVVVPIKPEYDWDIVKQFTHVFVNFMEQQDPKKYISKMSKKERKGKIFVDYLRNQRGATAVAAYSPRARLHAPVATPVHWDELTSKIKDTYYTIKTLPKRLQTLKEDPWDMFWEVRQSLRLDEL